MTITTRSEKAGKYLIEICANKYSAGYVVRAYEQRGGLYGYPIKENYYSTEKAAGRRFSELKRKAIKNEL